MLKVAGSVNLVCQRCLDSLVYELDSTTTVMVAKTEEEADEIEESLEDEEAVEVIVSDGKVEVMDLVEDEAASGVAAVGQAWDLSGFIDGRVERKTGVCLLPL